MIQTVIMIGAWPHYVGVAGLYQNTCLLHLSKHLRVRDGGGRLLYDLLVTTLDRAVSAK